MKVIFLDIDGVLNTTETFKNPKGKYINNKIYDIEIDRKKVEYLKRIIDETGSKIVLSSTWRYFFYIKDNKVLPRTEKGRMLKEIFDIYEIQIFDLTIQQCELYPNRKYQIKQYLDTHQVDNFIILDDEVKQLIDYKDNLLKTYFFLDENGKGGLLEEHIDIVINKLNNKVKKLTKR